MTFTVCSINVWGLARNWSERCDALVAAWDDLPGAVDVVMLQEICRSRDVDQLHDLAHRLGFAHQASAWTIRHADGQEEGVGLLSALPLGNVRSVLLAQSHPARAVLSADVQVGSVTVRVASAHTVFHPDPVLDAQLDDLLAVNGNAGNVVIGADLNASPARVAERPGAGDYRDALSGVGCAATWPVCPPGVFAEEWAALSGRAPDFPVAPARLDHILVRGEALKVTDSAVRVLHHGGRWPSDHAAVCATFAL